MLMKKFLLMLVAVMVAVTSFAQLKERIQVSSLQQFAKPQLERTVTPMKYTGKIQNKPQVFKKSTASRALASASELEGEYIACSYQYYVEQDEATGESQLVPATISRKGIPARIEATGNNTINIYGINSNAYYTDLPISATVNLETGAITIAAGQTIWNHATYGDFTMYNMESETGTDAFTGTANEDGTISIDQLWAEAYGTGDNFGINGAMNGTFLAPVNGSMSYTTDEVDAETGEQTGNRNEVTQNCFISQSEDAKSVTVWNFHNFDLGEVVDIAIEADKTFSIAGGKQTVYYNSNYGYFTLWGFDGQYLDDLYGKVEGTQLKAEIGMAIYLSGVGGWTLPEDIFTIELIDGSEFAIPEAETGELVTLPAGLTPVEYPFSFSVYVGGQRQDMTSKAKIAKSENDFYFQGLDIQIPEAWVKGTYDAEKGTITVPVTYTGAYEGTPHFFAGYGGEDGPKELTLDYDADADTYSYSAAIMIYKGSETTQYAYYYNGLFLGTKPSPTTAPENLVTTDMPFKGNYGTQNAQEPTEVTGTVKVGRDGDDLYIQNLFASEIPGSWLKGTFTTIENKQYVVFPMNQYVGDLSNGLSAYLTGYMSGGEGTDGKVTDVYFLYNAEDNYYTAITPVILTRFKSTSNFTAYYAAGMTIGDAPSAISDIKTVKNDDNAWYNLNGVRVAQPTQKGLYIHNGKKFVIK